MIRRNRRLWLIGLAIAAIVVLTLLLAPGGNPRLSGSTYNRAPGGYGAWFAYMQQQKIAVERWQRSPADLSKEPQPITLLRVNYEQSFGTLIDADEAWLRRGNTLIELGVFAPVSDAAFSTMQTSPQGKVKIDTTRRARSIKPADLRLGDDRGAIVWREAIGRGQVIRATTPHLAANAYQNEPGNFAFLAQLVQQGKPIFVDEYLHGYRDPGVTEADESAAAGQWAWMAYLAKTPLILILIQGTVLVLVLLWAQNQRFGAPVSIAPPPIDNSEAYIQALAGVLYKAGRSEFVIDTVGKAEQIHIQKALGLGATPIDPDMVRTAWQQQTNQPTTDLDRVLTPPVDRRVREQDLLTWVQAIKSVRHHLP